MTHAAISGTCLCGAVSFTHKAPEKLVRCNCTACRRYSALWAHGPVAAITVTAKGALIRYIRPNRDGDIVFVSCATCGVTTHWDPVDTADTMAVNAALCDPKAIKDLLVRNFDGADTWSFMDNAPS